MNNESKLLLGVKSPSALKKAGELPPRVIELKWVYCQSLVPKFFSKVSALFPIPFTNICFTAICLQAALYLGLRQIAFCFLPQLLGRVPACERW